MTLARKTITPVAVVEVLLEVAVEGSKNEGRTDTIAAGMERERL